MTPWQNLVITHTLQMWWTEIRVKILGLSLTYGCMEGWTDYQKSLTPLSTVMRARESSRTRWESPCFSSSFRVVSVITLNQWARLLNPPGTCGNITVMCLTHKTHTGITVHVEFQTRYLEHSPAISGEPNYTNTNKKIKRAGKRKQVNWDTVTWLSGVSSNMAEAQLISQA